MDAKTKLYVISHTHWDREWYQSFQGFRRRLVLMMDELIEHMEENEAYKYFHLDGQTIVLEDYLQIRPENEKRLKDLIKKGRIIIGPWYVMPDEFLISGESQIRNLQKGFSLSNYYGADPMKCGYVTDIFGHNSQFPQILKGFGIESAILFRGIGDYEKDAFTWEAKDGSKVLCMKMDSDRCYSNFFFAIRWPFEGREYENGELITRMQALLKHCRDLSVSEHILMMDGVDHCEIEPHLIEILSLFNSNIEGIEMQQATIEEFANALMNSGSQLEVLKGELYKPGRKGINNRVLKNVLSSMVHIKQMNNECETLLTKWAEPFDAVAGYIKTRNSIGFFEEAWKSLMQNHPHDSICGCSVSRVHKDNEYRFDQVMDITQGLLDAAFMDIVQAVNTSVFGEKKCVMLFNASQRYFNGIVETEIEFPSGSQGNFKIFDYNGNELPYQLLGVRKDCLKQVVEFRKVIDFQQKDYYRVAFNSAIPPLGYSTYGYEEYKAIMPVRGDYTFKEYHAQTRYLGTMQTRHKTWENEYLKVSICENGTLNVVNKDTGKEYKDLLIFEDCSDIGDGWDYKRSLKDSSFFSFCGKADFSVEANGPLAVQLKFIHYMNLPIKINENGIGRQNNFKELTIVTYIDMKMGSRKLQFRTEIDNNIAEHRLRVLFPNYLNSKMYYTSTPFALEERSIKREDNADFYEFDTGVVPNQGVTLIKNEKNGLALYNKGLYEVEVSEDDSHTIALTLFRSVKTEFGKDIGEMSFMYRRMTFDYALEFFGSEASNEEVLLSGDEWRTGIKTVFTDSHTGILPECNSFMKMDIPGAVLSSFRINNKNMKVIRFYNSTKDDVEGSIALFGTVSEAYILNLNEEPLEKVYLKENKVHISLRAAQIITIRFNIFIDRR